MKNDIKAILQMAGTVKFIKSYKLRQYGHVERKQNQDRPKHNATATMEGTSEIGRPCKNGGTRLKRI